MTLVACPIVQVPYYLGFLTEKLSTADRPSRLTKVEASKSQLLVSESHARTITNFVLWMMCVS